MRAGSANADGPRWAAPNLHCINELALAFHMELLGVHA